MVSKLLNYIVLLSAHSSLVGLVFSPSSLFFYLLACMLRSFILLSTAALVLAYLVR
jgi:hypothetical protein